MFLVPNFVESNWHWRLNKPQFIKRNSSDNNIKRKHIIVAFRNKPVAEKQSPLGISCMEPFAVLTLNGRCFHKFYAQMFQKCRYLVFSVSLTESLGFYYLAWYLHLQQLEKFFQNPSLAQRTYHVLLNLVLIDGITSDYRLIVVPSTALNNYQRHFL